MISVMPSRIAPAAAAFAWNAWSGRDTQLNIWIGIAVNGSLSQCERNERELALHRRLAAGMQ